MGGAGCRLFAIVFTSSLLLGGPAWSRQPTSIQETSVSALPPEARQTIRLIRQGGPFPYQRDGTVFGNFERLLPLRERGFYREYTVPTPGTKSRGARRIIAGRNGELYYTDDHYKSFRRVKIGDQ